MIHLQIEKIEDLWYVALNVLQKFRFWSQLELFEKLGENLVIHLQEEPCESSSMKCSTIAMCAHRIR